MALKIKLLSEPWPVNVGQNLCVKLPVKDLSTTQNSLIIGMKSIHVQEEKILHTKIQENHNLNEKKQLTDATMY